MIYTKHLEGKGRPQITSKKHNYNLRRMEGNQLTIYKREGGIETRDPVGGESGN